MKSGFKGNNKVYGSEVVLKQSSTKNSTPQTSKRNYSPRFEKKRATVNFIDSKNSSRLS
jgi:hypothetical protein